MLDLLSTLFQSLGPLWEMSLTAAYAAAVVIGLRLLLKKRAPKQVLCLLWLVVFARLLIPVSLESPLSIVPNALPGQEQQIRLPAQNPSSPEAGNPLTPQNPVQSNIQSNAQNQPTGGTVSPVISNPTVPSLSIPEDVTPTVPDQPAKSSFPWQAIAAGVWLVGAAAMGLYALASYFRLRRRLFDAIRARDGAWEHPDIDSPFILGMLRPRIYLPAGLVGQPRKFILCHERAHLRRLDHIVKPVCWVALALHWFNPMVWAAFILMSRDIESACDEAVVRQLGSEIKADYSTTLLALATGRRTPTPCPLAFDEGDAKGRIKNVLGYRRPALWVIVVSAVMAIMAAVCLLTDPVAAKEPAGDPDSDPDPAVTSSQAPDTSLNALLDPWMKEVLDGERTFRSFDRELFDGNSPDYTIHQLRSFYYGEDQYPDAIIELGKLAIIDLDRDGVKEMVIWPEGDYEYLYSVVGLLVLRRQGDTVYSYNPSWRTMGELKEDGTFNWSAGAGNWGIGSAQFTENGFDVHDITWSEYDGVDEHFFVEGQKATREEFEAASYAQYAKLEPIWYVYEDGRLKYLPSSIPLDDDAMSIPVPDFLDADQQQLYRQMFMMYTHLFGPTSESVDSWPGHPGGYGSAEYVEQNGTHYVPATGLYANWKDFEEAVLSVFTPNYWQSRNYCINAGTTPEGAALYNPLYTNIDYTMHYVDAARGNYGCNPNFPETFRLVEQTEDRITFIITGYYSDPWPVEGESYEERDARLAAGWEYSVEYPIRMVRTDRGWRFDEFYCPHTDNGQYGQQIPNPDAPPRPAPPEPTAPPERVVISELDGMQIVSVDNVYRLIWSENGQEFPVGPSTVSEGYHAWVEDFDEDGSPEALFPEDGSFPFTIYDMVGGALVGYPFPDMNEVYSAVSTSSVAAYNPDTGNLTMTFPWGEGDSRRYVTINITLPSDFFSDCEELEDGRPLRMSVTPGGIDGMAVPRGINTRASVALTDGNITSPQVGYLWFGVHYSDRGFEIRTPEESDFWQTPLA